MTKWAETRLSHSGSSGRGMEYSRAVFGVTDQVLFRLAASSLSRYQLPAEAYPGRQQRVAPGPGSLPRGWETQSPGSSPRLLPWPLPWLLPQAPPLAPPPGSYPSYLLPLGSEPAYHLSFSKERKREQLTQPPELEMYFIKEEDQLTDSHRYNFSKY